MLMENTNLLEQLIEQNGLTEEQAIRSLAIVAEYGKEKFPILEGTINAYVKQEFKHANPDLVSQILNS